LKLASDRHNFAPFALKRAEHNHNRLFSPMYTLAPARVVLNLRGLQSFWPRTDTGLRR